MAYSIFTARRQKKPEVSDEQHWADTLKDNIFVLCKTPMAVSITRRTLVGFRNLQVNAKYRKDLVKDAQEESSREKLASEIQSGKNFWKINEDNDMKFDAIVGNPPYQENISTENDNKSLAKQLFPSFIELGIDMKPKYFSLITPSRWFSGNAQDSSFIKLRNFLKQKPHFTDIYHYANENDIFKKIYISGGINYFLYSSEYTGNVNFYECTQTHMDKSNRPLFEDGLDIVLSMNKFVDILKKVKNHKDFISMTTMTQGRNAFGIVGKESELLSITKHLYFENAIAVRCAYEKIRYIERGKVKKGLKLIDKWKIFISKGNGGAGILNMEKPVSIIGKPYIGAPGSICTDSLIPIGCFETKEEASNLSRYLQTKFVRFLIGILKISQNIYQNVYTFVPVQDFKKSWTDEELYKKYALTDEEIDFIETMIKPMK